jgi:Phasin protein
MSGTDQNKPAAKSGRRSKKGEARRQKVDSPASPAPVHLQNPEPVQQLPPEPEPVASPEPEVQPVVDEPIEAVAAAPELSPTDKPSPVEPAPAESSAAEPALVSLQTIANAYRDYTKKSFAEFGSFFEQLSGVRSLDKAVEVQTEFVKRAYESSVTESQKIRELHRKLARQTLEPFEALAGKTQETHRKS